MEKVHVTGATKTHEAWSGDLETYVAVGDCVDEAMWWHFLEVLPPRTHTADLMQVGEPSDHAGRDGSPRFSTFQRYGKFWYYTGRRVAGDAVALMQAVR